MSLCLRIYYSCCLFVCLSQPKVLDSGKGLKWFVSCTQRHPKMHYARLGTFKFLVVHHPETVKVILSSGEGTQVGSLVMTFECVCVVHKALSFKLVPSGTTKQT